MGSLNCAVREAAVICINTDRFRAAADTNRLYPPAD